MKSARKAAKANADYQKTMAFMEEKEKAKEKAKEEMDNPPKEEELRGEGEQVRQRSCVSLSLFILLSTAIPFLSDHFGD